MPRPSLLIVDVQERLFNVMDVEYRDDVIRNIKTLAVTAHRLGIPVIVSEQYPNGWGRTLPELREILNDGTSLEKTAFSCCGADGFVDRLRRLESDHVIMTGLEAHVCVLLTTLDLLNLGFRVTVAADAVCSRTRAIHDLGLAQARQAGAVVSATVTVVFQPLGRADTDVFREILKLLR